MAYYVDSEGNTKYTDGPETIMVRGGDDTATDLAEIAARMGEDPYVPGLIAYTPGYAAMYQLGADGQFVEIGGGSDE